MQTFLNILLTLIIFLVIIIIHEFGHFIAAKMCNVKVNEFSIGMGPQIFRKRGKETLYSVRAFPIGGFVSMEGEDSASDDPRAFRNQNVLKRIFIIVAGAFMNLVLGFLVITLLTVTTDKLASNTVSTVKENSLISQSGIRPDDTILKVNDRRIFIATDISYEFAHDADRDVSMVIRRNGEKITLDSVKFDPSQGIGFTVKPIKKTFSNVIIYSLRHTACIGRLIWVSIIDLVTGKASVNDLSGPVGMTQVVGDAAKIGLPNLTLLLAFITINVGIFNILPVPALDGGRLLFLIIEAIRRKPVKPEHEGYIHFIGFALVILLMIFVTFNDILKLVK